MKVVMQRSTTSKRIGRRASLLYHGYVLQAHQKAEVLPEDQRKNFKKFFIYGKIFGASDSKIKLMMQLAEHKARL